MSETLANDHLKYHHYLSMIIMGNTGGVDWNSFSDEDWRNLFFWAQHNGVAPLVYRTLKSSGLSIPDQILSSLTKMYYNTSASNLQMLKQVETVTSELDAGKVEVIVLKGADLARRLYPEISLRPMGDVDILVRVEDLQKAIDVIVACDYDILHSSYHVIFTKPNSLNIELHWCVVGGNKRYTQWFWEQSIWDAQNHQRNLTPLAALIFLIAHIRFEHDEPPIRLIWLYDIYLLLMNWGDEIQWERLSAVSKDFYYFGMIEELLLEVKECFGADLSALTKGINTTRMFQSAEPETKRKYTKYDFVLEANRYLPFRTRVLLLLKLLFPSHVYMKRRYHDQPTRPTLFSFAFRWLDLLRNLLK